MRPTAAAVCEYREAFAELLARRPANYFVSLAWNRSETLASAWSDITRLNARVDAQVFGSRYASRKSNMGRRSNFTFVFEHLDSNLHAHGFWFVGEENAPRFASRCCHPVRSAGERLSVPPKMDTVGAEKLALNMWTAPGMVPSGTSVVERVWDQEGAARYMAKALTPEMPANAVFFAEDMFDHLR